MRFAAGLKGAVVSRIDVSMLGCVLERRKTYQRVCGALLGAFVCLLFASHTVAREAKSEEPSRSSFNVLNDVSYVSGLDANTEERMAVVENSPGYFELQVLGNDPVAGAVADLAVSLEFPMTLIPGAIITFTGHQGSFLQLQLDESGAHGFVEFDSPAEPAVIEPREVILQPVRGDSAEGILPILAFELAQGELPANSRLLFTIRNLVLPQLAPQSLKIQPWIMLAPQQPFRQLTGKGPHINPGQLSQLTLIADSITRPGEDINLRLRQEDEFGNMLPGRELSLDLLVNGQYRNRINVSDGYTQIPGVVFEIPGVYELEVRTGGGGFRGVSNPVLVQDTEIELLWLSIGDQTRRSGGYQTRSEIMASNAGVFDVTLMVDDHPGWEPEEGGVRVANTPRQGLVLSDENGDSVGAALAEEPTDLRYFTPDTLDLIQTAGPGSDYRWYGDAAASRGYRVGYFAFDHSLRSTVPSETVYTGLTNPTGNYWFDSLADRQSFVSIGEKITLLVDSPELQLSQPRNLDVTVVAASEVERLELFKNGQIFDQLTAGVNPDNHFNLTLSSSSRPYSGLESKPRNPREWIGYLATSDSDISPMSGQTHWQLQRADDKRFDFLTLLHGGSRQLSFTIEAMTADTVLEIGLAPVVEDAAWLPVDRAPQAIASKHFLVSSREMQQGATRIVEVDGYRDQVAIEPALKPSKKVIRHRFVDDTRGRIGDYYLVQVVLVNGNSAYSSPIFVEKDVIPDIELSYDSDKTVVLEQQ